jgi:hypothetical protein
LSLVRTTLLAVLLSVPVIVFVITDSHALTQFASKPGQITFETFRMISTGMTREEVVKLAGPPTAETYRGCLHCSMRWIYNRDDGWIVEVTFSEYGQVARVTSERQVLAESHPTIGDILRDPQDYQAHLVTLKGTIRQLKDEPSPLLSGVGVCYGASHFTLEDGTGALPMEFLGVCNLGPDAALHLAEGDAVTVHAIVNWNQPQYTEGVYAIVTRSLK